MRKLWSIRQARYIAVGAWNTLFGYGIFVGLLSFSQDRIHYVIVLAVAHAIAVVNAYLGYKFLVFKLSSKVTFTEFLKFNAVYLAAFIFNLVTLPILVEVTGMGVAMSQAIVIIITVILSYLAHGKLTFSRPANAKSE